VIDLTKTQIRGLKARAQHLEPLLRVGRNGLSESFLASLSDALKHHELVKIRFEEHKDRRRELAAEMAERSGSRLIWIVGHVAVLYRPSTEPPDDTGLVKVVG
jgi:RNA-binding protein